MYSILQVSACSVDRHKNDHVQRIKNLIGHCNQSSYLILYYFFLYLSTNYTFMKHAYHGLVILLFCAVVCGLPIRSWATTPPQFSGGRSQTMNACENSNPNPINSLLTITDPDLGQTETWTLIAPPHHGGVAPSTFSTTSTGGSLTPTGFNYTPGPSYIGQDTFKFQISDGIYADTTTIYVTVHPLPQVGNITGPNTVCVGDSIALADTPSGYWLSWHTNATVSATGFVAGVAPGHDTIIYHVANICGAVEAIWPITINPAPNAGVITGPDSACAGSIFSLFETSSTGVWSSSNPLDTIVFGVVHVAGPGVDTIYYSASNAYCTMRAIHPVVVQSIPHVSDISGPYVVCEGSIYTYTDTTSGGHWSSITGNILIDSVGVVTGLAPGVDTITYVYADACGSAATSRAVMVSPLPVNSPVTGDSLTCAGATVTLTDTTIGGVWSSSDVSVAAVGGAGVVYGIAAGAASISYTTSNDCGLVVQTQVVTVNSVPVVASISGPATLCVGTHATFTDTPAGGTWSALNATAYFVGNNLMAASQGIDTVMYRFQNNCGADSTALPVTINPLPVAGSIEGVNSICPKDTAFLLANVPGGTWSFTDTTIAGIKTTSGDTVTFYGRSPGTAVFYYSVTNMCGTATISFSVTVGNSVVCPSAVKQLVGPVSGISVYPNPNMGSFVVLVGAGANTHGESAVQVYDVVGRVVEKFEIVPGKPSEIITQLGSGVYWLKFSGEEVSWTQKMVVTAQ